MKRTLKQKRLAAALGCLLWVSQSLLAQSVGQWDFESADLSATAGSNLGSLQYADGPGGLTQTMTRFGTTATLGIPVINGTNALVMSYAPETNTSMGYWLPTPAGASYLTDYTLVLDVLYPAASMGKFRPLLQTDDATLDNVLAYLGVSANNALTAVNVNTVSGAAATTTGSAGQLAANTWYRLGFVVNLSANQILFYTNGVPVGSVTGSGAAFSSVYAPAGGALVRLFGSLSETNAAGGYVNSVQFRDVPLSAGQMSALGGPSAAGIPVTIPPVPSFIFSRSPGLNDTAIAPLPAVHIVLDPGDFVVDPASINLTMDGTALAATVSAATATQKAIDAAVTTILDPLSIHTLALAYQDNNLGWQTNIWSFAVAGYQNLYLPATPVYSENFDAVAEGGLPAGWIATNWTDTGTVGLNLDDPLSDSYKNWVVINVDHYVKVNYGGNSYGATNTYTSPGLPAVTGYLRTMIPPIVLNGVLLPQLATGNLIVAESDQRGGSQVQVLFTKDYDLTGVTNAYLSFYNLNEQNQDNICSVEYSVDQGVTWLPLLYMLDDGTTDSNGSDVVTNATTGKIDVLATFNTVRSDQAHNLSYGTYIGAAISTNLIPYIRPCRNDDPVQQKRIELFRLAKADGQSNVRFRFMQAGTASWFFDIDNFAIYSINTPVITTQPLSQSVEAGTPANFTVVASGNPPLSYQWKFNGANIVGATNAVYTIANAARANAGQYQVVVSNGDGPTKSSIANLTIITTPQITTQPIGTVVDPGASVSILSVARGGRPLGVFWLLNGAPLANAASTNLVLAPAKTTDTGSYQLVATNVYGAVTSSIARVIVYEAPITNSLVVHLTFDDNLDDSSGRTNHATYKATGGSADPAPVYAAGQIGQAFVFTTRKDASQIEYATLGYPADLMLDDTVDFTVSFWVNYTNQGDDLPFISNKNWASSNNRGWGIFSQNGGNFRVQGTGPTTANKQDTSSTPTLRDGKWHNVVVSEMRGAQVFIYLDGNQVKTQLFNTAGIDTPDLGYAINIGQDGTGAYTDGGSAYLIGGLIDDMGIWRRALTPGEAAAIYTAGLAGKDLTTGVVKVALAAQVSGNNLGITWLGSPTLKLQQSTRLNPTVWTDVPGTLGASSASVPLSGPAMFFRLSQ